MPEERWFNDYVFIVEEFLTKEECQRYIQIAEDVGFEDALVSTPQGQLVRADVRNNQRVMFKNEEMAASLWERAEDFVPSQVEERIAIGVNELLRFYRYDPGQKFNWHQDYSYVRDNGEESFWTMMVYLNEGFEGGETAFEDSYSDESFDEFQVTPREGMALFFEHPTHHKGEAVISGRKYVLRTDVMYSAEEESGVDGADDDDEDDDW